MKTFKTQADIYQALLSGKSIFNIYKARTCLKFIKGFLRDTDGKARHPCFESPEEWAIYEPPKPIKRVEYYAFHANGDLVFDEDENWGSGDPLNQRIHNLRIEDGKLIGEVEGD